MSRLAFISFWLSVPNWKLVCDAAPKDAFSDWFIDSASVFLASVPDRSQVRPAGMLPFQPSVPNFSLVMPMKRGGKPPGESDAKKKGVASLTWTPGAEGAVPL